MPNHSFLAFLVIFAFVYILFQVAGGSRSKKEPTSPKDYQDMEIAMKKKEAALAALGVMIVLLGTSLLFTFILVGVWMLLGRGDLSGYEFMSIWMVVNACLFGGVLYEKLIAEDRLKIELTKAGSSRNITIFPKSVSKPGMSNAESRCPKCGSPNVIPILYGLIDSTALDPKNVPGRDFVCGGCCPDPNNRYCKDCGASFKADVRNEV